jgi:uncharacterized protein
VKSSELPVGVPDVNVETEPFWTGIRERRLVLPFCESCADYVWYPRSFCPKCGLSRPPWRETSGRGTVYAFTVVHRSPLEAWRTCTPFIIALVELAEGPRVLTNIVGCDPGQVHIDMEVEAVFESGEAGSVIYRFAPCEGRGE